MENPNLTAQVHPHVSGAHSYCNTTFDKNHVVYEPLIQIVKVDSSDRRIWNFFKCKMCLYQTKYFQVMRSHLKRHKVTKKSKIFTCDKTIDQYRCTVLGCEYKSLMLVNFNKHILIAHCTDVKVEPLENVKRQALLNTSWNNLVKKYNCESCSFWTHSQLLYVSHYKTCPVKMFLRKNAKEEAAKKLALKKRQKELAMFRCSMCSFKTKRQVIFNNHMDTKHPFPKINFDKIAEKIFRCSVCAFKTSRASTFRKHLSGHKEPRVKAKARPEPPPEEVPTISVSLESAASPSKRLRKRSVSKTARPVYHCWKCPFKSYFISGYVAHLSHRHFNAVDIQWIHCDHCKYKSIFPSHLKKHVAAKHASIFRCTMCTYSTTFSERLKVHILKKHIAPVEEEEHIVADSPKSLMKNFACTPCGLKFIKHEELKEHILTHHVSTETVICFKCQMCSFKTIDEQGLKEHVIEKHVDPQLTEWVLCDICQCKFRFSEDLKKHIYETHIM